MSYTENDPTVIGGPTKKSDFAAAFDNSQFNRDSVGDFSQVIIGTGVTGAAFTWRDDLDTHISNPAPDIMAITVGSLEMMRFTETTQDIITVNNGSVDIDFQINANSITPAFHLIGSSGNVGIGTIPTSFFHLKRTLTGAQSSDRVVQQIHVATSDGNMSDGFGPTLRFTIEDVAAVANSIGEIQCLRDGADNSGKILFLTYLAGTESVVLELDSSQNAMFTGGIDPGSNGTPWKTKIVDIGDWDMNQSADGDANVSVAHGVTQANIRSVSVLIRDDGGVAMYALSGALNGSDIDGRWEISSTNITLYNFIGGRFDGIFFDTDTSYNRGWIYIDYV